MIKFDVSQTWATSTRIRIFLKPHIFLHESVFLLQEISEPETSIFLKLLSRVIYGPVHPIRVKKTVVLLLFAFLKKFLCNGRYYTGTEGKRVERII